MEKNSIRVGQQSKIKIEVNDAGEYIEINPDDKRFTLKLNGLIRTFREEQAKVMKALDALTDSEEDALKALEEETVVLSFNGAVSPFILQNEGSKHSLYLILPVRNIS